MKKIKAKHSFAHSKKREKLSKPPRTQWDRISHKERLVLIKKLGSKEKAKDYVRFQACSSRKGLAHSLNTDGKDSLKVLNNIHKYDVEVIASYKDASIEKLLSMATELGIDAESFSKNELVESIHNKLESK